MLFQDIIVGPIHSRRLGTSLGVNLLPTQAKICTFNCIYCECGYNFSNPEAHWPTREEVKKALENKLIELKEQNAHIDVITFAGNGEPTTHPQFNLIIDDTLALRDKYFPEAKVSVLSNATMIDKPEVFEALNKVDNNILKLDAATEHTLHLINQPNKKYNLEQTINRLAQFHGNVIIQTLFFKGTIHNEHFDNTSDTEVKAWLEALRKIQPKEVMLYSLDRATPAKDLVKATPAELQNIAKQVEAIGIPTQVTI